MGRPLQKKKNRSSLPRVRQKPKSKRVNIKSNPIIAANWDQKLTLAQNYRRLGLSSKLNAYTGGTEAEAKSSSSTTSENRRKDALAIPTSHKLSELKPSEVKVTRDPKTGAILSVQHETTREREKNPLGDPLNELSDSEEEEEEEEEEDEAAVRVDRSAGGGGVVAELEEQAKYSKPKRPQMQSQREKEWIERLVGRWGDDWGGMFRDRKLNPRQQTEGDLRRRVGIWKKRNEKEREGRAREMDVG